MLNNQLPESQYQEKKPKTLKIIPEGDNILENHSMVPRSMKKIGSEKNIRAYSIERNGSRQENRPHLKPHLDQYRNGAHNVKFIKNLGCNASPWGILEAAENTFL